MEGKGWNILKEIEGRLGLWPDPCSRVLAEHMSGWLDSLGHGGGREPDQLSRVRIVLN